MGVPSYFRWLAEKYGKTVVDALEVLPQEVDGVMVYPNLTEPNPNGIEFDNLYLDMNGIIHPCSHPENKVRFLTFQDQTRKPAKPFRFACRSRHTKCFHGYPTRVGSPHAH